MTTTKTQSDWDGVIQNSCDCMKYDPIKEEYTDEPADDCYGDCWETAVFHFTEGIKGWYDANPTYNFTIDGLPLWNRSVSGEFTAKTIPDFIRAVTVNDTWRLRWQLSGEVLHLNLSHHDVPMGRGYTVRYALDEYSE